MKRTYMKSMGTFSPSVSTQMEAKIKNLQGQIDTINDSSDVTDVVATYSELTSYDKSTLTDKDVIKVLTDSSHDNKTTYYRYVKDDNDFTYIGAVESYYTKAEADAKLKVHTDKKNNPHSVTKAQVGLGNCDNTSDADKPVSTATQTALDGKQATLVSGTNIKTINGNSIVGSGDLEIAAHLGYPSSWPTTSDTTTKSFCDVVAAYAGAVEGKMYLGEVRWSDLPESLVNGEVEVEIMSGTTSSNKVITLTLTSGNRAPYMWKYTYWNGGNNVSGWIGFQPKMSAGTNISISNNTINCTLDAYTKTESDGKYLTSHQDISGKADKATTLSGYGITDAYTKTESDNKYLTTHQDISNLATKTEVSTGLAEKQNTITGSSGEVVYHNGTSVFTQSILNLGYACASTSEVNQCKNNAPSFSDVFNTWKKFSHRNATNDAIPSEMTAWTYDSGTDTITQPLNTESYVGFISPKSYSSYDITVRCYSTGSDDDSIGLVAAFAKDSNGLEHTLSFIRSPGGTSAKWVAILDYNQFALTGTSYGQKILVNNSAASTTPASTANWNTESIGTGTVIKMVRSGNVITAKCSQFNSNTIDDNTLITVDLDALSADNPTLNLFKGASQWGYSNFSQPNSKYENISVTDPDGMIFDIPNNQVLQYSNGTWVVVSGQTPISEIGAGRLSYNSVTGKLFFCTGTDIIQIGTNTDI